MSRFAAVLLALTVAFAWALPAAFGRSPAAVLGWKAAFPNGQGFGTVKPRTVYLGETQPATSRQSRGTSGALNTPLDSGEDGARVVQLRLATRV
jgi:hypothetical protein